MWYLTNFCVWSPWLEGGVSYCFYTSSPPSTTLERCAQLYSKLQHVLMYNVHCTVQSVYCTVRRVQSIVCTVQWYSGQLNIFIVHCTAEVSQRDPPSNQTVLIGKCTGKVHLFWKFKHIIDIKLFLCVKEKNLNVYCFRYLISISFIRQQKPVF